MKILSIALFGAGLLATSCFLGAKQHELRVIDEDGLPLSGIAIKAGFTGKDGKSVILRGVTNKNGIYSFSANTKTEIAFTATAESYYKSQIRVRSTGMGSGGYAIPKGTLSTLTMKAIREPTELYGKFLFSVKVPELDKKLGFDMEAMDWVSPYGNGVSTDLFFEINGYFSAPEDRTSKLTLSFPEVEDGVLFFDLDHQMGSELKSDHLAPEHGYQDHKSWNRNYVITNRMHTPDESPGNVINEFSKDSGLFLRLRTISDENGKIIKANYAKLYGDPTFSWDIGTGEGAIYFRHVYFNPKVNDRNLEFDRERNFLKNLKSKHRPRYP